MDIVGTNILHPSYRLEFSKDRHITSIVLYPLRFNNIYLVVKIVKELANIE